MCKRGFLGKYSRTGIELGRGNDGARDRRSFAGIHAAFQDLRVEGAGSAFLSILQIALRSDFMFNRKAVGRRLRGGLSAAWLSPI